MAERRHRCALAGDARFRRKARWIAVRFVDERNRKWVPRIKVELKSGKPTAIVAGALHVSGPKSIVRLLEKRGYKRTIVIET